MECARTQQSEASAPEQFAEAVRRAVGAVAIPGGREVEQQAPDDGHDQRGGDGVVGAGGDARERGAQGVEPARGEAFAAAVAASTAFPGSYPPITLNGRRYLDGSLRSATNAALAAGARTLVVIDPQAHLFPRELLQQQLAIAAAHTVLTVEPDPASLHAFGPDLNDRTAWAPAHREGRRQAAEAAAEFRLAWKAGSDPA
ncbi:patatin-like phospholipase family protein [Kitasatospora griseola]|uniref:patatin-like phospholipase family protein n=1 Tax=Kitasatospora griseola TaxID=2064 RepID=UPI0036DF7277